MQTSSTTTTTLIQQQQDANAAQRQSSFQAGHTNSGPINAGNVQRMVSEVSSYPSQYVGQSTGMNLQQEDVYYQGMQVIGEQVLEHQMVVPTRKIVEEIVEKVVVVPEKVQREEICEEHRIIRERIIHVAKPVEKIVYEDVIEVVPVDKIKYIPQVVQEENVVMKDVWQTVEVVKEVPKYVDREKVVEYEVIEYKDVPIHKTVEVEEKRVIEKTIEKPIPRYVEVEIPEYKEVEVTQEIHRAVPSPVEVITEQTYKLPTLEAEYEEVPVPIFVPAFTEIPLPAEYLTEESNLQMQHLRQRIAIAAGHTMPSLCVIEDLGREARSFQPNMITDPLTLSQRIAPKIDAANH